MNIQKDISLTQNVFTNFEMSIINDLDAKVQKEIEYILKLIYEKRGEPGLILFKQQITSFGFLDENIDIFLNILRTRKNMRVSDIRLVAEYFLNNHYLYNIKDIFQRKLKYEKIYSNLIRVIKNLKEEVTNTLSESVHTERALRLIDNILSLCDMGYLTGNYNVDISFSNAKNVFRYLYSGLYECMSEEDYESNSIINIAYTVFLGDLLHNSINECALSLIIYGKDLFMIHILNKCINIEITENTSMKMLSDESKMKSKEAIHRYIDKNFINNEVNTLIKENCLASLDDRIDDFYNTSTEFYREFIQKPLENKVIELINQYVSTDKNVSLKYWLSKQGVSMDDFSKLREELRNYGDIESELKVLDDELQHRNNIRYAKSLGKLKGYIKKIENGADYIDLIACGCDFVLLEGWMKICKKDLSADENRIISRFLASNKQKMTRINKKDILGSKILDANGNEKYTYEMKNRAIDYIVEHKLPYTLGMYNHLIKELYTTAEIKFNIVNGVNKKENTLEEN